jgi:hypothetical protein
VTGVKEPYNKRQNLKGVCWRIIVLLLVFSLLVVLVFLPATIVAAPPLVIIQSQAEGYHKAVNINTGEVIFESTNKTHVATQTIAYLERTGGIIQMPQEDTWNYSVTVPNGITIQERKNGTLIERYSMRTLSNNLTNIFGFAIQTSFDRITYFYRQGTTHAQDKGDLVMNTFILSEGTWSNASTIYSDPILDSRNIAGGIIDGKVYLFFYRYNYTTQSKEGSDIGYIVSTDLTCSVWSEYTSLATNVAGSPYGTLIQAGQSTRWLLGYYAINGNITELSLITSDNNGQNWQITNSVYNGSVCYAEPAIAYLEKNRMLMLAREDFNGPLHQFTSSDDGVTWRDDGPTNLGSNKTSLANIPSIQVKGNDLFAIWADRGTAKIMLSKSNINVYSNASSYDQAIDIGEMTNVNAINKGGYPSQVLLQSGDLFYVYGNAENNQVVDITSGIIKTS